MGIIDWLIVIIPVVLIVGIGVYSRRYVRSVADFLSAGRVAGRYVMSVGDVANALSILGLVAYVEVQYKTGFALVFWNNILLPLGVLMSLLGYCTYRFRETRAMSLGQFLELRYNRPFRIFASALRSLSEMLANMIMPALAARFFIYFLDLPHSLKIFGFSISTFTLICLICLTIAITIIYFGGTLSLLITDALQGMLMFPLMLVFIIFILYKFNWATEIIPVMEDRVAGESFLNPFDVKNLRDFNLLMITLSICTSVLHRASWIGAGYSTAGKTPHETKMAGVLGTLRTALTTLLYALIAISIITLMNHTNFAQISKSIRCALSAHIAEEIVSPENRSDFLKRLDEVPEQHHKIGKDKPLSQTENLDTPLLTTAHQAFIEYNGTAQGNANFQQFRTLYHQQMLASGMRRFLPPVIAGLFCLLLILAMISTDDTRIYSASLTLTQDVILPLMKKRPSPEQHIRLLRISSIGVGLFFLAGSSLMSQLDYVNLFVSLMTLMWLGGCGPVMIFGLYSRRGNSWGAFASLISGMILAFISVFLQRNWASLVFPFLQQRGWDVGIGAFLEAVSAPLNPYVVWHMNPVKFPINSYELSFLTMIITLVIYVGVSWMTQRELFNLDRMLHRGIYRTEEDGSKENESWSWKTVWKKLIGITPEYTRGDRLIAWGIFLYSIVFNFVICFVFVAIWNSISPWPIEWWGIYFWITTLGVPGIIAFFSSFWFGIGGARDIFRLFRDLEHRKIDVLDNGMVEGQVALADQKIFSRAESQENKKIPGK